MELVLLVVVVSGAYATFDFYLKKQERLLGKWRYELPKLPPEEIKPIHKLKPPIQPAFDPRYTTGSWKGPVVGSEQLRAQLYAQQQLNLSRQFEMKQAQQGSYAKEMMKAQRIMYDLPSWAKWD